MNNACAEEKKRCAEDFFSYAEKLCGYAENVFACVEKFVGYVEEVAMICID